MENKKGLYQNTTVTPNNETTFLQEPIPQKISHQHNVPPQQLRLLQYGLKIPSHQHNTQLNHQINFHLHQHPQQIQYKQTHRHQQTPTQQTQSSPNQQYGYQYPPKSNIQIANQSLFQNNQPPPLHAHNQMIQNSPQIWVPHQRPVHYHQKLQNKPEPPKQLNILNQLQSKPREKENSEKKKSNSGNSQLRSPSAKRPLEAPVTKQGWLHKQGSEGLMLWKKRWFVLSEYCLFYYKGPEEEKLLGSILLPSYKVSICGSEDKVNRKYAFKCEHANMRTYILAADSQELMSQWVHVLSLACLLQTNIESDQQSNPSLIISYNHSTENSDSGFHQQMQSQTCKSTPVHTHSSSNTTDLSNPSQQELSQYNQPLYANAPPKPRRLNDGGYSSPSPDVLDRNPTQSNHPYMHQVQRSVPKSPISIYGVSPSPEYMQHRPKVHEYVYGTMRDMSNIPQNFERRTPDTYGRSKMVASKSRQAMDYEDVYADYAMYKRPLSPVTSNHIKKVTPNTSLNPAYRAYTPVNMLGPKGLSPCGPLVMKKSPSAVVRPHSADFLEYEVNHRQQNAVKQQQPRPKSSLDINRSTNDSDSYFDSEERYAERMRMSAQYLPKMPRHVPVHSEIKSPNRRPLSRYPTHENTFPLTKSNTHGSNLNTPILLEVQRDFQTARSKSVMSDGSLSKELENDLRSGPCNRSENESRSPIFMPRQDIYHYNEELRNREREYDQFTRSASARLSQAGYSDRLYDTRSFSREGDRKREESMKRLLEWKQRMLQSPLNRKVQGNRVHMPRDYYYKNHSHGYPAEASMGPQVHQETRRSVNNLPQYNSYSSDDEASGSISINVRDTFPRTMSSKRVWNKNGPQQVQQFQSQSQSTTSLPRAHENDDSMRSQQPNYCIMREPSQLELNSENNRRKEIWPEKMKVSAGELLGRTHEELVLLLIQLRRQSSNTLHAIENCYSENDKIQAQLHLMDQAKRLENLQKLEQIKQHLIELEKQYERGKPLVNLVDNMVKLGSLYRTPNDRSNTNSYVRDRLEFNQQVQERRLLAEERRDWNRLNPNHLQLQEKVQQLYQLDQLIQEESGTLQTLQHDKEAIERALGGLRMRLTEGFKDPSEVEQARKQQIILENELSRVHSMLAQNSKKLEETVAGNARLEQELLVLKQKLQNSRQQRNSPQFSNAGDSLPCVVGTSAMLESDLQKVQQKVGDLQKQRQELSMQVRQLTDRSNTLQQQLKPPVSSHSSHSLVGKKKVNSLWRETDLDSMHIVDHGDIQGSSPVSTSTPLYINTDMKQTEFDFYNSNMKSSDSTSDDTLQNVNLTPHEKQQEIKTVRIVKRESERRQRDREKTVATGKWDPVLEEDDSSQSSSLLFTPAPIQKTHSTSSVVSPTYDVDKTASSGILSLHSSVSSPSLPQVSLNSRVTSSTDGSSERSPELSPVFKSEAARQIITEMSVQDTPKQINRRTVPKEKRRHYTAPHNNLIMKSLNQISVDDSAFDKMVLNDRRAKDDLDMERALRQRIDTPDVVRSTLSNKELKYNENTIDNILGTPNKIRIPERYIPEQLPQLSAEEQEYRLRKVESIKKMLSDTAIISGSVPSDDSNAEKPSNSITSKATTKILEEKKQREHLLQLNQILAKQVMEMSKIVAGTSNAEEQ